MNYFPTTKHYRDLKQPEKEFKIKQDKRTLRFLHNIRDKDNNMNENMCIQLSGVNMRCMKHDLGHIWIDSESNTCRALNVF